MKKKIAAAGLAAGLVACAGAGIILERSGSVGASAGSAPVTPGTVGGPGNDTDRTARLEEILQPLIDAGTIDQAQADAVITAIEAAGPVGDHMGGDMDGHMGRGGFSLEVVATTLGITADDVRTALRNGTTLADLATAHGKTAQDVIDALVAEMKAHLDEEVAAGEHSQAEADARLAEATARITGVVNGTGQLGPMGPGMGGRMDGRMGRGHVGDRDDDSATVTTGA